MPPDAPVKPTFAIQRALRMDLISHVVLGLKPFIDARGQHTKKNGTTSSRFHVRNYSAINPNAIRRAKPETSERAPDMNLAFCQVQVDAPKLKSALLWGKPHANLSNSCYIHVLY